MCRICKAKTDKEIQNKEILALVGKHFTECGYEYAKPYTLIKNQSTKTGFSLFRDEIHYLETFDEIRKLDDNRIELSYRVLGIKIIYVHKR